MVAAGLWWLLVVRPAGTGPGAVVEGRFLRNALVRLGWYVRDMNFSHMLPLGVVALAVATRRRMTPEERSAATWVAVAVTVQVLLVALVSPQPARRGTIDADLRYVAPILPFVAVLGAVTCSALLRWDAWAGSVVLALWLLTGVLGLTPSRGFLGEFVAEAFRLRHVPETSTEGVVDMLRRRPDRDPLILVTPEYRRDPLMFYLGDRARFCGVLPAEDKRIVPRAADLGLPPYVYAADVEPDTIIWFRRARRGIRQDIYEHVRKLDYAPPRLLRVWWDDPSRPELTRHAVAPPRVDGRNLPMGVWIVDRTRKLHEPDALDTARPD